MQSNQEIETFRRQITGEERRFLMAPTMHISLGLRFRGELSGEALRNAVDKMLITYPLFGARIEWSDEGDHWSTTEGATEVPVKVYPRENAESWIQVLNQEHTIPTSLSKGPLTRFLLVKGSDTSELIVFCHHAISDGRSLQFALREVLLHIKDPNREPSKFSEATPLTPEILPDGIKMGKLRSVIIGKVNQMWDDERTLFDEEDLSNIWEAYWKNSEYCIETIEFDRDETQKLIEASRKNEVTLNSTLLMAFVKARIDAIGSYERKVKVGTAVDLRKRLRVDCSDAVGCYAGGSLQQHKYKEKSSFWDNVRTYHKDLTKKLKDNKVFDLTLTYNTLDPTLVDAIVFLLVGDQVEPHQSRYEKISEFASKKDGIVQKNVERSEELASDVFITNLGVLSLPEDISGIEIERSFFPPASSFTMEVVIGASTAAGRLTVTLNYHSRYIDGENIGMVRDNAEEILKGILEE